MWPRHHGAMPVGVIDVGSNTVRLHVVRDGRELHREKAMLRLGESIERYGAIPRDEARGDRELSSASFVTQARAARRRAARGAGHEPRPPGRERRRAVGRLAAAARRARPAALARSRRGGSAFLGAPSRPRGPSRRLVAVCDVGGGSAQIAVGTRRDGPGVGPLDRHRLDAAHEPDADRRPAERRGRRRGARRTSTGSSRASCRRCRRARWPSAAAPGRCGSLRRRASSAPRSSTRGP